MTHEPLRTKTDKPRPFILALLFVMPLVLGIGCTLESEPEEEVVAEIEPEEEVELEPELEDGPVPFGVLRNSNSEASQRVVSCWFNEENINSNSANEESLSGFELVIDSQIDFDTYISCNDTVSVNLEEELVLAGMTTIHPVRVLTKGLTVEIINDSIYFRVGLLSGHTHAPSRAEYIIKISGDYIKYPVIFDVYWEE
jgi:hypothetical protein